MFVLTSVTLSEGRHKDQEKMEAQELLRLSQATRFPFSLFSNTIKGKTWCHEQLHRCFEHLNSSKATTCVAQASFVHYSIKSALGKPQISIFGEETSHLTQNNFS